MNTTQIHVACCSTPHIKTRTRQTEHSSQQLSDTSHLSTTADVRTYRSAKVHVYSLKGIGGMKKGGIMKGLGMGGNGGVGAAFGAREVELDADD